jgi:hypothetical protein
LQSETFNTGTWSKSGALITADATVSPDGTADADKMIESAITAQHRASQAATVTSGSAYTFSIYAKAAERTSIWVRMIGTATFATCIVDLTNGAISSSAGTCTATNVGNGWYRITISGTSDSTTVTAYANLIDGAGANTYLGDGTSGLFIYGAQLEAGAFATSYTPTVASQVTRSADIASMTGTNYSSWYNPSEGTLVAEFTLLPRTLSGTTVIAYNGSSNGRWSYLSSASARMNDGTNTAVAGSIATPTAINKTASALSSAGMAISLNGAAAVTSAYVGAFGPQDALNIGQQSGAASINGHIRQIAYYNTRLPNDTLQALTA